MMRVQLLAIHAALELAQDYSSLLFYFYGGWRGVTPGDGGDTYVHALTREHQLAADSSAPHKSNSVLLHLL